MRVDAVPVFLVGGLAVAAALWAITRQGAAGAAGEAIGSAVVEAADGAIRGTVVGVGQLVGIPDTDADQCTIDLRNGDLWAASFSCPAPRYLKAVATGDYGPTFQGGGATGSW